MKYLYLLITFAITICIIWINVALYEIKNSPSEKTDEVVLQLNYLEKELKTDNLGLRMQALFPEGFVFVNALYGLTWCELALSNKDNEPLKTRAIKEALYAYHEIDSDLGRQYFEKDLEPDYGIFYNGWRNYLLAKILSIPATFEGKEKYQLTFISNCDTISNWITHSKTPYAESYFRRSWPADMFLATVSLKIHDNIYPPKHKTIITKWLDMVKLRLDTKTQMLPHQVNSFSGEPIFGSRGGSMALMLKCLAEIDSFFAASQYQKFKNSFVSSTIGMASVREYPKGIFGLGDIDSGPVIFGVGFAATIVSIGTFQTFSDFQLSDEQYRIVNAFGFGITLQDQKRYLFGLFPMADAFIAWSRASNPVIMSEKEVEYVKPSYYIFTIISLGLLLILWLPFYKKYFRAIKDWLKIKL